VASMNNISSGVFDLPFIASGSSLRTSSNID
jgi:hypothetical protein